MATSNISNTILDLSGSAVSDVVVVARLKPGPGFRIYEGTEVASQVTTTSASNGAWSLTLEQNEPSDPVDATKLGISPSGSYYEIEEQIPDAKGGLKSWTVTVGTTSQTLYAALVTTLPADVGPTYLTQTSGDARYSQLGNIGSTSTTAVAATASQGTASSAARSDHVHNIANGTVTTLKTNISFETTAARDAAITSPVAGMICYINTGDANEGLYSYTGTTWNKGASWNAPWGVVSRDQGGGPAISTSGATETAVFTSTAFTAVANRYYRVSIATNITATVADAYTMRLREDSTAGTIWWAGNIAFGTGVTKLQVSPAGTRALSAGSHTMLLTLTRTAGVSAQIAALEFANMTVEDIGPSGVPN